MWEQQEPRSCDPCPGICAGTAAALASVIPLLEPVAWLRLVLPFPGMELAKVFPVPCSSRRLWSPWALQVPWQWRKEKSLVLELAWVAVTPPAWEQGSTAAALLAPDKQPLFQAPGTEPSSLPALCQLHAGQTPHASFRCPRSGWQRGDSGDTHRRHPVTGKGTRPCPVTGAGRLNWGSKCCTGHWALPACSSICRNADFPLLHPFQGLISQLGGFFPFLTRLFLSLQSDSHAKAQVIPSRLFIDLNKGTCIKIPNCGSKTNH